MPLMTDSEITFADVPMPGTQPFADMELLHESRKGYCRVFQCVHHGRRVVVKALREEYRDSAIHRDLLRKEFTITASMTHENVISAISMEEVQGLGEAMVLEYFDGISLTEYLRRNQGLPRREAMAILEQICAGVAYIHSRRIIHRDLKPGNILVTPDGRYVKIIDFGLSHGPAFTQFDIPGGTAGYMAPEAGVVSEDPSGGFAADIYSLGCIMAQLGQGHSDILWVACRCMAVQPGRRPPYASLIMPMVRRRSRGRRWLAVVACVAVVTGTAVWYSQSDGRGKGEPVAVAPEVVRDSAAVVTAPPIFPGDSAAGETALFTPAAVSSVINNVADTVAPAGGENLPLEEEVYRRSKEMAARQFAWQLQLWDTLTTMRSMELAMVGHWRWRARRDVYRWLTTRIDKNSPYLTSLMDIAAKTIVQYENEHKAQESERINAAMKRPNTPKGATLQYTEEIEEGRFVTHRLEENGKWSMLVEGRKSKWMRTHPEGGPMPDFSAMEPDFGDEPYPKKYD